jgi:UDP-N-acetylglucosamine 4,6-dehydratase
MNILKLIGRDSEIFKNDILSKEVELSRIVKTSSFLVIGGAGSIGQAVTKEIFKRNPTKLHIVDISENNTVELVRDLRSSYGYIDGDFKTFALDVGSIEYDAFIESDGEYDYVLNLSALKHVRSEKDPFTLMRMIDVNIFNTEKTVTQAIEKGAKKYFCVSTDKATNPVNMMGASKRIMEMYLINLSEKISISTARFANVAFSDGSLLHGFNQRIQKKQPIVAPNDIKRYFITPKESGELCLISCIYGENRDVFFPKLTESLHLISFADIAMRYLKELGYEAYLCDSEEEARNLMTILPQQKKWPCLFRASDTSGEKDFEEFFTEKEILDMNSFTNFGIIKNSIIKNNKNIESFKYSINEIKQSKRWSKKQLVDLFYEIIPDFKHKETGKYLDSKM